MRVRFGLLIALAASWGCFQHLDSGSSQAAVLEACRNLRETYVPPAAPPGFDLDPSGRRIVRVVRDLGNHKIHKRTRAAREILARSECHDASLLEAAIAVEANLGEYRSLYDLFEIVTEQGFAEPCAVGNDDDDDDDSDDDGDDGDDDGDTHDDDGEDDGDDDDDDDDGLASDFAGSGLVQAHIPYAARVRTLAAAAIGRVLERDLQRPPGHPHGIDADDDVDDDDDEDDDDVEHGIPDHAKLDAVAALSHSACPGPLSLRASSLEALGRTRHTAATPFLDLVFAAPGETDPHRNTVLKTVTGRSLTNILHNNHLQDTDADERFADLVRALNAANSQEAP